MKEKKAGSLSGGPKGLQDSLILSCIFTYLTIEVTGNKRDISFVIGSGNLLNFSREYILFKTSGATRRTLG
ncbi:hypothetical protein PPTG_23594 [Phytophthora nicotianae INRA-310]|uniref:Uncharacterized protein n=1 Tax=Phytophthora nicotianae (strain INRA-310) TaxID=761204 RepID=W2PUI6_PHYN3|nr:hypothetical protein PPTG_23594 [Phytophthora nicotianae INRA-310]ETN04266.1 hypothetical protein PPTG_23594 [Phytophthora nicotianae INRA-310]